jgi:hypothetical protein
LSHSDEFAAAIAGLLGGNTSPAAAMILCAVPIKENERNVLG